MEKSEFSHIGWVPSINGHLDFGLIKPGIIGGFTNKKVSDPRTTLVNYPKTGKPNGHHRRVMMQSWVDWKDTPNEEHDGKFRVFVLCEVSNSDNLDKRRLTGSLFLYLQAHEPESREARFSLKQFSSIHNAKKLWQENSSSSYEKAIPKLNKQYDELCSTLNTLEDSERIDFVIEPNGLIYLNHETSSSTHSGDESYILTRQAYYYLKYSIHEHKHHDNDMDALMTIVPNSAEKNEIGLKLLGQLKRELTSIKRTFTRGEYNDVGEPLGILSYMNSLCETLKQSSLIDDFLYQRELSFIESVKASFCVQSSRNERYRKEVKDVESAYRTYLAMAISGLSILALIFLKPFFEVPQDNVISSEKLTIQSAIAIFVWTMVLIGVVYLKLKQNVIRDTLTGQGFKEWVNKYYHDDHADIKELTIGWLILVCAILILGMFI